MNDVGPVVEYRQRCASHRSEGSQAKLDGCAPGFLVVRIRKTDDIGRGETRDDVSFVKEFSYESDIRRKIQLRDHLAQDMIFGVRFRRRIASVEHHQMDARNMLTEQCEGLDELAQS